MKYQIYQATPKRQAILLRSLQIRKQIGEPTSNAGRHYTDGPDGRKVLMGAGASTSFQYPITASAFGIGKPDLYNIR